MFEPTKKSGKKFPSIITIKISHTLSSLTDPQEEIKTGFWEKSAMIRDVSAGVHSFNNERTKNMPIPCAGIIARDIRDGTYLHKISKWCVTIKNLVTPLQEKKSWTSQIMTVSFLMENIVPHGTTAAVRKSGKRDRIGA
jgi:hypothetical protein